MLRISLSGNDFRAVKPVSGIDRAIRQRTCDFAYRSFGLQPLVRRQRRCGRPQDDVNSVRLVHS